MIRQLTSTLALFALGATAPAQQFNSARPKYNFNSGWLVKAGDEAGAESITYADTDWKKVTLPYAWNEDSALTRYLHSMRKEASPSSNQYRHRLSIPRPLHPPPSPASRS